MVRSRPVSTESSSTGERQPSPAERQRVLVVDDSVGSAKIIASMLSKFGNHEVVLAHDGASAVETALSFLPSVVFLDIGLPRISGYEVARQLREHPELANTMLVALTGYGTEEDRRRTHEAGFDYHLVKPVSVETVRTLLSGEHDSEV